MNYKKLEELFVDYILSIIGPDSITESQRTNNLKIIKQIIIEVLKKELPDYITYVIPYGSFPVKTYLKDADVDITICFESKKEKKMMVNIPVQIIDKAILIIKEEFEKKNREANFEIIRDIKIIMANIRLLKCRIGNINIDITINNFAGLYKIIFINFIEEEFKHKFNILKSYKESSYSDNKRNLFRRTLLLIKGWCLYEGKLMGSNMGLMATYTLEILVIYIFNYYYDEINNEFEGFEKFFEIMQKFNWEKEIISLFGIISNFNFFQKLQNYNNNIRIEEEKSKKIIINKPFWYLEEEEQKSNSSLKDSVNLKNKESLLSISDTKNFMYHLNKGMEYTFLRNEGNTISSTNFDKMINVLDPLNNHNNLGRSITYHNKSRMKIVISFMLKKLKNINQIKNSSNPFIYMNYLLNLFKDTLSTIDLELFEKFLKTPKIIVNSKIYKKFIKSKEEDKFSVDKADIIKFNKLFSDNDDNICNGGSLNLEEEDLDEYEEDKDENKIMDKSELNEEEEDEDADQYEEDIGTDKNLEQNHNINENSEESENEDNFEIKENVNFEYILNKEIMKKLFELYYNKENTVKSNNIFIMEAKEYSVGLEKFLYEHNLI